MPANLAKIEYLPPRFLKDALEIINFSNLSRNRTLLGHKILEAIFKIVYADSSVLFLADENQKITTSIVKNLSEKKSVEFLMHYCRLDPFNLLNGSAGPISIFRLEDVVDRHSFLTSEYYNDFYKPQKIYHKLFIKLQAKGRLYGELCMHRSSKHRNFSEDEIRVLKMVTPCFAHALEHNELRRKIKFKDSLLNIIDDNLTTGIIILDDSLKLVYINKRAREFCRNLFGYLSIQNIDSSLPPVLLEDCHKIKSDLKNQNNIVMLPEKRVFQNNQAERYHVTSRLIEEDFSKENQNLFMISIEKFSDAREINGDELKKDYHLTDREAEIALQIFKGLKNAEIARKLFVAEITVKWHIRNLFEKVGVNTRTALINKILSQKSQQPHQIENIMV